MYTGSDRGYGNTVSAKTSIVSRTAAYDCILSPPLVVWAATTLKTTALAPTLALVA